MNKKLLFGMVAAATLWLNTACTSDDQEALRSDNQARVSFTLGLEGNMATRTISDGKTANELVYAVFDANGSRISAIQKVDKQNVTFPAKEEILLAKGQTYKVAFWAQNKSCTKYTVDDNMNVTIDYSGANNDETRDAFFKTETFTVSGDATINVELRRPFAQINVGVEKSDWDAAVASGETISTSEVVIDDAATSINLVTGAVSGSQKVTYSAAAIPAAATTEEVLTVGTTNYKWLSMSYILVNDGSANGADKAALNSAKFTLNPASGNAIVLEDGLTNVPVQRNWRTNILGRLLSGKIDFNITLDKNYDGDHAFTEIKTAADLTAALAKGGVYAVTADLKGIDLTDYNGTDPLVLNVTAEQTGKITVDNNTQAVTISVAKDVKWPEIVLGKNKGQGLSNVTIKGVKGSTEKCKGITIEDVQKNIENLTFEDIEFEGKGVVFPNYTRKLSGLVVRNCTFSNLTEAGVEIQNFADANLCDYSNITVEGCTMSWASGQSGINGIHLTDTKGNVTVRNNSISGASYHGIFVRNSDGIVAISGNNIDAAKDGIKLESSKAVNGIKGMATVTITDNTINGKDNGIRIVPSATSADANVTIEGNTITAPTATGDDGYGILFTNKYATAGDTFSGVLTVKNNKKSGTLADASKWFVQTGFDAADGSDINTPWNN